MFRSKWQSNAANSNVKVDGTNATAIDLNRTDGTDQSLSHLELNMTKEGTWKIRKLIKDDDFQAMMKMFTGMRSQ